MQPILLLPGALGYAHQFNSLIHELRLENKRTVTLDLPNHSRNISYKLANTVPLMAEAILAQLDGLNQNEPINIFGHSLGGYIGLYLCIHHPKRVNKLFTLGTKWLWNQEISERETALLNIEKMKMKVPKYVDHLNTIHMDWKNTIHTISHLILDLGNNSYFTPQNLPEINHTVRFALGDKDNMVTFDETISIYHSIPNSQFQVYPNTPHPFEKIDFKNLANDMAQFFG